MLKKMIFLLQIHFNFRVLFEVNDIEVVSPKVKCFNIHKNKRLKHEKYVNSGNLCAQQQSSSDIKIVSLFFIVYIFIKFFCLF